ncbi:phosphoglycerate mutase-like protein [Sparassis crispa]|uniref:Phosphoglycerate mutase-like protein n=1 Tax=Sparassis crispa TaxID=139825 RepID=A0A401GSK8_9APHY|nr:phosphoglycerate mutase-like protein [Sparassis crispa]GBE85221.1 phosphoglycerate mutase-like protein [Sparassis crispa]
MDSAAALVQGLWPAITLQNTTLANGSTIISPLGGYQYIPIKSVEPNEDVSLEGFTNCNALDTYIEQFYNSTAFAQMANETSTFFAELPPHVAGKAVSLENIWNIFDYMNVNSIHNASFLNALPPTFLAQATALANWHEYNINSDIQFDGIGNIAIRTMLPGIIDSVEQITNAPTGLKLAYTAISYKPFLSLFNMTGVVADGALPPAIVGYAASVVLEVRQPSSDGEPVIRFNFKNGTADETFSPYPMKFPGWDGTSGGDVPMSTFISAFAPATVNTTLEWCQVCGVTDSTRGCSSLITANAPAQFRAHYKVSPVGAGFLGAGLTVVMIGALLGVLIFLGVLTLGAGKLRR